MKASPSDKMVRTEDESTKVRNETSEVSGGTKFFYPKYRITIEASTQEEADRRLEVILKEREQEE